MTVGELIEKLESYADEYGDNIPVKTFDLDRWICDINEVEYCKDCDGNYIYLGSE